MAPAELKSSRMWDLSAIGGSAFAEVREGVGVSSVVASALFRRSPDERRILSEFGEASQLFKPLESSKGNAGRRDPYWELTLSIRDALGLGEDFVPNAQLSNNRRFRVARQLQHVCLTVMVFDATLAIPDAWEGWLQHRHLPDDQLRTFLSFNSDRTLIPPAAISRPTSSLFRLFEDARKLVEPRRGAVATSHPHRMVWDAHRSIWQLIIELYADDSKLRQAQGLPGAATKKKEYQSISGTLFCSAYLFMLHAALKRKALENPPPGGLLSLGAYMPRSAFAKIASGITGYLNDETDKLPYASEKCSRANPLGLRTVSPKAHKDKHWCAGVVPVDLTDWPVFTVLQERGFYKVDDPRSVDAVELHKQVSVMALEVLGPEIWHIS